MDLILAYRTSRKLTQGQVAAVLGVSTPTVHRLEVNKAKAGIGLVYSIAKMIGVPVELCMQVYGGVTAKKDFASIDARAAVNGQSMAVR